MDVERVALAVSGSLVLWINVHFVLDVTGATSRYGRFLTVNSVHAFFMLGLLCVNHVQSDADHRAEYFTYLLVLSSGFYLYHLWRIYRKGAGPLLYVHHILTATILIYVLRYMSSDEYLSDLILFIGSSLITEPVLVFKRLLKYFDLYSDVLGCVLNWTYACLFSMIRLSWGVKIYKDYFFTDVDVIFEALMVFLFILGLVFSCRIVKFTYDGLL